MNTISVERTSSPQFSIQTNHPFNLANAPISSLLASPAFFFVHLAAQEWSWHTFPGPQTCRIHIPLPYHELGLPNIDPNNDKGSY